MNKKIILRKATCDVVAVTPIHNEDAALFLNQLFAEFDRLNWEVVWHINRMSSQKYRRAIIEYPRTIGYTFPVRTFKPFCECDRQDAFQIAQQSGASWVVTHDADEIWEPLAVELLPAILANRYLHRARWYNVWEVRDDGTLMIRVDPPAGIGLRARFYPIGPWTWEYRSQGVASPYSKVEPGPKVANCNLRILHWGFSTPELRQRHYDYWHRRFSNSDYWQLILKTKAQLSAFDPTPLPQ